MSIAWIQVIEILFAINRKHWEIFFWNFRMKKLNFGQLLPRYWSFNCPYTYYLLSWKWHELGSQHANINKYTNGKIVFEISLERSKKGLGPFFISILRNRISPLVYTTYIRYPQLCAVNSSLSPSNILRRHRNYNRAYKNVT